MQRNGPFPGSFLTCLFFRLILSAVPESDLLLGALGLRWCRTWRGLLSADVPGLVASTLTRLAFSDAILGSLQARPLLLLGDAVERQLKPLQRGAVVCKHSALYLRVRRCLSLVA